MYEGGDILNQNKYSQMWNLDSIFQGGSKSIQLHNHVQNIEELLHELDDSLKSFATSSDLKDSNDILSILIEIGNSKDILTQVSSFITCVLAQNSLDIEAKDIQGQISKLSSKYDITLTKFKAEIAKISLHNWEEIIESEVLKDYKFTLIEWRKEVVSLLTVDQQVILSSLATDGYHAWGQMYQTLMSNLEIEIQLEGKKQKYSIGQALNLRSHSDRRIRKLAHEAMELKWLEQKEAFAKIINHIAGFRLQMYNLQGMSDVLEEPLRKNRVKKETLEAMWSVVSKNKQPFVKYLNQKGKMNHDEKMQSYNFWSPLTTNPTYIDYDDAIDLVKEHFSEFGTQLEAFTTEAIEGGWIESENRSKKSAAAFCANFPSSEESRIFMTFGGTMMSVLTLVHELGHAFHNSAMNGISCLNKQYPLSIAETASTFAEMIVLDGAVKKATTISEKITLLDEKLKRSVMNFMNIHSRFLFEKSFYEERKKGIVSTERLNELMQEAIFTGYDDSLDNVSVFSWLWTPHFYITNAPFYNFPYTFGYLLALSLFAKAKEMGTEFESAYIKLLRDSGKMSTEELVLKHLNEDLTSEAFWEKAIKISIQDAESFIELTNL